MENAKVNTNVIIKYLQTKVTLSVIGAISTPNK